MQLTAWFNSYRREAKTAPNRSKSLGEALEESKRTVAEWTRRCGEASKKTAALKERLRQVEARAARMRAHADEQRAARQEQHIREGRLIDRVSRQRKALEWAKRHAERSHRAVPLPRVLRGALPLRVPTAQARARQAAARQAEQRFSVASASYEAAVRAASQSLATGEPIVRTSVQGLHWWVPALRPRDAELGSPWLKKQRFPYRGIAQTRELAMGGIMLDLGANIGRMSLPRVILGDVIAAYCAEPDPLNYSCLVRNVIDNGLSGLVCPDNIAIGDREGLATLSRASYCGGHSLVGTASTKGGTVTVPTTTLDAWVARLGIDLDLVTFIKVDVQGWEGHVFAGATGVLSRRHVAWQVEFNPALLRDAGTDPLGLCRRLGECFTHFTDLNKSAAGPRARAIAELGEAIAYVEGSESGQTDLLLFNQYDRG